MLILSIFYTATWARAHKRSQYFTLLHSEYKQSRWAERSTLAERNGEWSPKN